MEKYELDSKVTDAAKSILSYCTARTSTQTDAEDLAQDIILELYKSIGNLKNDAAFYGFMWSVAGNVYKKWCKKKAGTAECELTDNVIENTAEIEDEDNSDIYLLRRELTLLSEKYRRAAVLYYIDEKSCLEISKILSISESMVKYLLFKSRQIIKEGMTMERNYGAQSYNPKELSILYWGNGTNRYYNLGESRISQNILFACYNDRLSAEEISLEIGVSLPYMEDKLNELCEYELIKKDGNKYYTNIVIFTDDFSKEVSAKTAKLKENIAARLIKAVEEHEDEIRAIGFDGSDMSRNAFAWQVICMILYYAVADNFTEKMNFPKDKFGNDCFVWGEEKSESGMLHGKSDYFFGIADTENSRGDKVQFMDFPINGDMVHYIFSKSVGNVFLDIARGNGDKLSENDKSVAAELIKKGYVIKDENGMRVNAPVLTAEQAEKVRSILGGVIDEIGIEAEKLSSVVAGILKNHIPTHLKKTAKDLAYLRLFEDAVSAPVARLVEDRFLLPGSGDSILPTTYVVLK